MPDCSRVEQHRRVVDAEQVLLPGRAPARRPAAAAAVGPARRAAGAGRRTGRARRRRTPPPGPGGWSERPDRASRRRTARPRPARGRTARRTTPIRGSTRAGAAGGVPVRTPRAGRREPGGGASPAARRASGPAGRRRSAAACRRPAGVAGRVLGPAGDEVGDGRADLRVGALVAGADEAVDAAGADGAGRGRVRWRRNGRSVRGGARAGSAVIARRPLTAGSRSPPRCRRCPSSSPGPSTLNFHPPSWRYTSPSATAVSASKSRREVLGADQLGVALAVEHPDHARAQLAQRAPLRRALVDVEHGDDALDLGRHRRPGRSRSARRRRRAPRRAR